MGQVESIGISFDFYLFSFLGNICYSLKIFQGQHLFKLDWSIKLFAFASPVLRLGWASLFFVNIEHKDEYDDDDEDEDDVEERVRKLIKKRSMMCGTFICKFTPSLWLSSDIRLSFLKGSR